MNNKDILQRFLFENRPVRGELVHLNHTFQTVVKQHDYPPLIRQLLGEALVVATLLTAIIKYKGRLTVQFRSKGTIKLLLAQCNQQFHLRGLVQWEGKLTEQALIEERKHGTLAILMDPEVEGGKRYQGIVDCQGESFAESIEEYFKRSEQLPTRLWLSVNEKTAAGLLLQVMPEEKPEHYQEDWIHLTHLANTLTSNELLTLDHPMLLRRLFSEEDVRLFSEVPVKFRCSCSVSRSENAILLLGQDEAEQELVAKQKLVVTCEFCNKDYIFDRVDVAKIFKKDKQSGLH